LAIADFPRAHGQWWPDTSAAAVARYNALRSEVAGENAITAAQIWLQMAHRGGAVLILGAVVLCTVRARGFLRRPALGWLGLILLQATLGAFTIWRNKAADIATLHVVTGAVSLATGAVLTIIAFRSAAAQRPLP
jgi:cytochrome c oxidase assembly protein subunit 15